MKYYLAFIIPLATLVSVISSGLWTYSTLILSFLIIPLFELLLRADESRLSESKGSRIYDLALYLMVPVQYAILYLYLERISADALSISEIVGMTLSMGIQCGAIGINVAHELGHRQTAFERFLAKSLLLSSLYMHFYVEHNRGHHKRVGTPADPATARLNESLYAFWIRSIFGSIASAWQIEANKQRREGMSVLHWKNEMLRMAFIEAGFMAFIFLTLGSSALLYFVTVAIIGMLLLETVNYIEHYGLMRKEISPGRYERVEPKHSWNSDYPIGRILLFELTRHSDHHYKTTKKYQHLEHLDGSPQLPTGYPGMMLLSLVPPLWFKVVNKRIPS